MTAECFLMSLQFINTPELHVLSHAGKFFCYRNTFSFCLTHLDESCTSAGNLHITLGQKPQHTHTQQCAGSDYRLSSSIQEDDARVSFSGLEHILVFPAHS